MSSKILTFAVNVLKIGAGYALAIPLFLFIKTTNLYWRVVDGLEN